MLEKKATLLFVDSHAISFSRAVRLKDSKVLSAHKVCVVAGSGGSSEGPGLKCPAEYFSRLRGRGERLRALSADWLAIRSRYRHRSPILCPILVELKFRKEHTSPFVVANTKAVKPVSCVLGVPDLSTLSHSLL